MIIANTDIALCAGILPTALRALTPEIRKRCMW